VGAVTLENDIVTLVGLVTAAATAVISWLSF
jgi:hypothetical protein